MTTGLAAAQASIDSLSTQLENFDGNEAELNTISSTLADVAADVKELLNNNNSVVNSNIIITNPAQLLLVESLVDSRTDAPNVIVNGSVQVDFTNTNLDADQKARAQAVVGKISTIVGNNLEVNNTSSPTTYITFTNLTFVDGDVTVNDAMTNFPKLITVNSDLNLDYGGAISFPVLSSVGEDFSIDSGVLGSVTSLDLSGVTIGGDFIANSAGVAVLPKATTANFGTAVVTSTTLAIATDVDLGHTGTLTSLDISAPKATTVDIAAKAITGNLSISNTDDSAVINLPNATIAGVTTIDDSGTLNLNKLTRFNGAATIESDNVSIPELSTNVSGTLTFTEATTLYFPKLVLGGALDGQKGETLTFKSGSQTNLTTLNKAESITIKGQANTTNFDATTLTELESLSITGSVNSSPTAATVTSDIVASGAKLETVTIAGMLNTVTISGAKVASVNTTGNVRSLTIENTVELTSAGIGHDHIAGSGVAEIHVDSNAKLTAVDLSSVSDVGVLEITDNALLTSFVSPNKDVRVEKTAAVSATVTGNKLSGVYTRGVAAIPGTDTTPAVAAIESIIHQSSVYGLRLWLEAHFVNTASPTWHIDIEAFDDDSDTESDADNGNYDAVVAADTNNGADNGANQINVYAELKTVKE